MRNLILVAFALLSLNLRANAPVWLTYGPDGATARTIVTSGECPHITIDARRERMRIRSLPGKDYPVTSCEAAVPASARSASIGDQPLPVSKLGRTAKIAILGDTGCRRKVSSGRASIQDCADPKAWPFQAIANAIAEWDPDLILNVGDYYYREAVLSGGKWVPSTYDWSRWNADWFEPAAKLLPNAPWVMVRGNHESCDRAAEGWFRFLEPRPYLWEDQRMCKSNLDYTPPYEVRAGDMRFIVIDSSAVSDSTVDPDQVNVIANELGLYTNKAAGAWMMLHHPIWAFGKYGGETPVMWTAWNQLGANAPNPALMLTGHMHLLEMISYADNRIPQLVVGNSGTALDNAAPPPASPVGGRDIANFFAHDQFGWVAATESAGTWTFDIRDTAGKTQATCTWREGGALSCATSTP
jgi:hypothetical protein